ncbi:16197_t:CDS:2 [Funneliformis geosporum]|uniref:16197_t:CDS:1 n=1 Tax=Funneliformis geosporum TaxID=1117311 RepID=A0A9W4WPX6_9GLOM|nr:16197_t:CDS:2 [Funneliformis geosporum]
MEIDVNLLPNIYQAYRNKNLIAYVRSNSCQIRSDRQVSVIKYFSKISNQQSAAKK